MNFALKQASMVLISCGLLAPLQAQQPSAEDILRSARWNSIAQTADLEASLRSKSGTTPLRIQMQDGEVRYRFVNPDQELILRLGEASSELLEKRSGQKTSIEGRRLIEPIRDTGINYEDLSLSFLYWPRPRLVGEDLIKTRPTWKLEIQAPRRDSQYGAIWVWIDKESGAIMRMEGYNREGKPVKRFEVISAQKIGGQWMLKNMRIESVEPTTRKVTGRTWLEILGQ